MFPKLHSKRPIQSLLPHTSSFPECVTDSLYFSEPKEKPPTLWIASFVAALYPLFTSVPALSQDLVHHVHPFGMFCKIHRKLQIKQRSLKLNETNNTCILTTKWNFLNLNDVIFTPNSLKYLWVEIEPQLLFSLSFCIYILSISIVKYFSLCSVAHI